MAMAIDELMERMSDPTATFTAAEVSQIVEHVERRALNDIYNKTRIAAGLARGREIVNKAKACSDMLMQAWETGTVPVLTEVEDEQETTAE